MYSTCFRQVVQTGNSGAFCGDRSIIEEKDEHLSGPRNQTYSSICPSLIRIHVIWVIWQKGYQYVSWFVPQPPYLFLRLTSIPDVSAHLQTFWSNLWPTWVISLFPIILHRLMYVFLLHLDIPLLDILSLHPFTSQSLTLDLNFSYTSLSFRLHCKFN